FPITTAPTIALKNRILLISNGTTYVVNSSFPRFLIKPISPVFTSVYLSFTSLSFNAATRINKRQPPAIPPANFTHLFFCGCGFVHIHQHDDKQEQHHDSTCIHDDIDDRQ